MVKDSEGVFIMLRHIVLMKFKEGVEEVRVSEMAAALGSLPPKIAAIKGFEFGRDIVKSERSYDFALVASFENPDALKEYQVHPEHVPVLQLVRSICDSLVVADFIWP